MNRFFSARNLLAATAALGGLALASAAHARTDVSVSIGVPIYGYAQPAPVYVQPRPVYVQPRPVYVQPAPVYGHRPVYVQPQPVYYGGHRHWNQRHGAWGDADRDGVANRYDRAPHNPYRR